MLKNVLSIPLELRQLKQWVLWRYEDIGAKKPTKVPYQINGSKASVTNPDHWSSFDDAFNTFQFGGYSGIGFVFTANDPYCFIDLDDCEGDKADLERQIKIHKEFDSYSELSPSGQGLHVIIKGSIPQGRRRSHIEIYSNERYATMTGNVYNHKPIVDRQEILTLLYNQMGGSPVVNSYKGDEPERQTDEQIINQAKSASNGDKFSKLYNGDWSSYYQSQSEADFALIDIIAFYTQNKSQVERIFRLSALGQRDKAKRRDYVGGMIQRSFDRMLPKVDIDGLTIALQEHINNGKSNVNSVDDSIYQLNLPLTSASVAQRLEPSPHKREDVGSNPSASTTLTNIQPPPGLLGEIAQFIYTAAPRPVPEIALAAAIGLMAGICGKGYNISGTGLNQYVLLIAMTGAGKEAMASGIDKLVNAVQRSVPVAPEFIGPSRIASGQALYRYLSNKSQCFVSIIGEFGLRIEAMSRDNANSSEKNLKAELLDLYNKSGYGQVARPSIYADVEKNTLAIPSPAFSILGESTPETFYRVLNEEMINEGLLPRFTLIEYTGIRPALNANHLVVEPPLFLVDKVAQVMANAKTLMASQKVVNVETTPEAQKMLNDFDKFADSKINTTDKEAIRQLWNRAHIKTLKLSALIAVGVNYINPIVTVEHVMWAKNLVEHDIKTLSIKFETGEIGKSSEEVVQLKDIKRVIKGYLTEPWEKIVGYGPDRRLYEAKIIPYQFINKRLAPMASFRKDRLGATHAMKRTIQTLLDSDIVREISKKDMQDKYGTSQRAFMLSDMRLLKDENEQT